MEIERSLFLGLAAAQLEAGAAQHGDLLAVHATRPDWRSGPAAAVRRVGSPPADRDFPDVAELGVAPGDVRPPRRRPRRSTARTLAPASRRRSGVRRTARATRLAGGERAGARCRPRAWKTTASPEGVVAMFCSTFTLTSPSSTPSCHATRGAAHCSTSARERNFGPGSGLDVDSRQAAEIGEDDRPCRRG